MTDTNFDILIIGGGPAGLTCGQYSSRAGRKTAVIEEMACGGQTMIIDEIENYPGLEKISGYEIAQKFEEQAEMFGCQILYNCVSKVEKIEDKFNVTTDSGVLTSKAVVIATGAKHKTLGVEGEDKFKGHGVSYCATCDGPFFKGKKILVCGGGDSAVQEAVYLTKLSNDVTICHRRDRFRAQDAVVKKLEKTNIKYKMQTKVLAIEGENRKVTGVRFENLSDGTTYTENFDAVFVFVGNYPNTDFIDICKKDKNNFIETEINMMTNVPGLFAAGDVRNTPFRQIVTAASDGAIAAHYASEYIDSIKGTSY